MLDPNKEAVSSAETSLNIGQTARRHVLPADLQPCALLTHTIWGQPAPSTNRSRSATSEPSQVLSAGERAASALC